MKNPQRENGHIDIANELAEALAKTQLSGHEHRILWALWRQTWGWVEKTRENKIKRDNKGNPLKLKTAYISSKKWQELTNLNKYIISRTLRELILRRIVIKIDNPVDKIDNKIEYGFQKDYSQWLPPIRRIVIKNDNTYFVDKNDNCFSKIDNKISKIDNKKFYQLVPGKTMRIPKETKKETKKETIYIYTSVLNFWNSQKIIQHKGLTDKRKRVINAKLKEGYSIEDIERSIKNYAEILRGTEYYWNYKWTLEDFLQRGLEKFLDLSVAKQNYKHKHKETRAEQRNREEKERVYLDGELDWKTGKVIKTY